MSQLTLEQWRDRALKAEIEAASLRTENKQAKLVIDDLSQSATIHIHHSNGARQFRSIVSDIGREALWCLLAFEEINPKIVEWIEKDETGFSNPDCEKAITRIARDVMRRWASKSGGEINAEHLQIVMRTAGTAIAGASLVYVCMSRFIVSAGFAHSHEVAGLASQPLPSDVGAAPAPSAPQIVIAGPSELAALDRSRQK